MGTSSSFGDSCGPGMGLGVLETLQLRLLVDVVRRVGRIDHGVHLVVHSGGGATRLAEEREVRRPHRVGGGHERADQRDPHEHRVAVVSDVVDDLVLGEEPGEREHAGEGERRHDPGTGGDRHLAPQPAHVLLHVEAVVRAGVAHRAGAQEQTALEEGMSEDVEHGRQPRPGPEAEHHVTELADRRVGEDLLDVVLDERQECRDDDRDRGDDDDEVDLDIGNREALPEHRIEAGDEEHAGDDHRRRVEQRRDRCRAGHRVGQPGVQRELAALADAGDEQGDGGPQQEALAAVTRQRPGRDAADAEPGHAEVLLGPGVGAPIEHRRADEQADVADAHGEERLEGRPGVGFFLPPVADEHERAQAHDLPAEDQLDHALGEDHHEHPGGEQRDGGEEVRVAAIAAHVLERVDLHEQGDEGDDEQGHHAEAVDVLADGQLDAGVLPPRPRTDHRFDERLAGFVAALDPLDRRAHGEHRRRGHRGDAELGALPRQAFAEQDDQCEGHARDHRDQPGVLEEPPGGDHAAPPSPASVLLGKIGVRA